jgi:hypothetical protein
MSPSTVPLIFATATLIDSFCHLCSSADDERSIPRRHIAGEVAVDSAASI